MKLSQNFHLNEFIASGVAARRGYVLVPDKWVTEQLARLVASILQPIRSELDAPMIITSGFRPAWLNQLVNGSVNSMHLYGCAADWKPVGMEQDVAFARIKEMMLPIDQCILEHPPDGWIHTGQALPGKLSRNQFMVATRRGDRVVYENA
jgi:hypothetical protein